MKQTYSLFISSLFLCVLALGYLNYRLFKSQSYTAQELSRTKTQLETNRQNFEILYNKLSEKISVLDESISPSNKRWAKIKKVREAVVDTIKKEGYKNTPDINGLTTYASAVVDYSEQYDVPVSLILALTKRESAFNPYAVSPAGARGLMQLMDETAKECSVDLNKPYFNIFKIKDNVQFGVWYMWKMLNIFNGDVDLAVRAYNAGPMFVQRVISNEIPDYPQETITYHEVILKWKKDYENLYGF